MAPDKKRRDSLGNRLDALQEQLNSARDEICVIAHVSELNTGELIRVEEALTIAAESAKSVVSIRRRRRSDSENGESRG